MNEITIKELAKQYLENAEQVLKIARNAEKHENISDVKYAYYALREASFIVADFNEFYSSLKKLASQYGGCVSCAYSRPHPASPLSFTARTCILGFSQGTCKNYKRIEEVE